MHHVRPFLCWVDGSMVSGLIDASSSSYVPGTGTTVSTPYSNGPIVVNVGRSGSGSGLGLGRGLPPGIASALQTVEGLATRRVERTVKTLTHSGFIFFAVNIFLLIVLQGGTR